MRVSRELSDRLNSDSSLKSMLLGSSKRVMFPPVAARLPFFTATTTVRLLLVFKAIKELRTQG